MPDLDLSKITVELVKQFAAPVLEGVKARGSDSIDKLRVSFNKCYAKYLERSYEKLSKTKTLLYREAPVSLKTFYVRTDLKSGEKIVKESLFVPELEANRRIVISGTAGSGKSTFCKSIFLDLVENPRGFFPIFIELRHFNNQKNRSLIDYITESMTSIDSGFSLKQLQYSLELGKIILILDGFDEINGEHREHLEKEIVSLSNNHHNILIMVSSRPDRRFHSWEEFHAYEVLPLDKEKALSLIGKLDYDRQVKRSFLEALDDHLFERHSSFARNPLLLTMMLLTYEQIGEIPNKIHLFYEQAFLTLFNKHDALKSLYKRKSFSGLPLDEFKKILSAFCIVSYVDKKYYFAEGEIDSYLKKAIGICKANANWRHFLNDLLDSVCIMQRDGLGYTFTHRSFQEYFTALFLAEMSHKDKYAIFDRVAFVNDRDDVISMIFGISPDLLEQEWVIPRLEALVKEFSTLPSTAEGKLKALSLMYYGLIRHPAWNPDSPDTTPRIAYHLKPQRNDHAHFFFFLSALYPEEMQAFYKERKGSRKTPEQKETEKELIRCDIGQDCLRLDDLSRLSAETKARIVAAGCPDYVIDKLDFSKRKLALLKEKHSAKEKSISDLLLQRSKVHQA